MRDFSLYRRLAGILSFPESTRLWLGELPAGAPAMLALALNEDFPLVLAILPHTHAVDQFLLDARAFHSDSERLALAEFPMLEGDTDRDPEVLGARANAAEMVVAASRDKPVLVVGSVQSLMQSVPDPADTSAKSRLLEVGATVEHEGFLQFLQDNGYYRVAEVTERGDWTAKGAIVDVWPLGLAQPCRIEFFGDEIETLRIFNPATQLSTDRRQKVIITPVSINRKQLSLLDLMPENSRVLWLDQGAEVTQNSLHEAIDKDERFVQFAVCPVCPAGWQEVTVPVTALSSTVPAESRDPELLAARRHSMLGQLEKRALEDGTRVIIGLDTEGMREHLTAEIGDAPFELHIAPFSGGFEIEGLNTVLVAQPDLYGLSKRWVSRRSSRQIEQQSQVGERFTSLEHINPGDLVVHVEHGIGRYLGTNEIEFDGRRREVLTIEYADNLKLHVPIWQAHLLSRYIGAGGGSVRLHRLGGRRWKKEKDSASRAIADLAASMLDTQARRSTLSGHAFAPDTPWMHEFEASFPHVETPDQTRCIADVKRDLQAGQPMDRLICGDAGYGKTEVALRAAYICAMQEKQVAVLVPTTVLAQQHYDVFRDRMAPYPLNIAVHSRFCSKRERDAALQGAADGTVDILIGTHGLLQPGVKFKNLGLVIIDEEQRFGVLHKEHFRAMRSLVDVLALSATPIPRTLQLGMTGIRDLSLLQTPPEDRGQTETRVLQDTDEAISNAIERELKRGGQVFYIYNRILTIERMRTRLERLFPQAIISVGHGQMPPRQIEETMRAFAAGETDILLCTTIVESGIDIPRANTIVIDRADRFGLADLYQLRGRVGRGARKGYAVFLTPNPALLDGSARDRLKALRQHSGAGAGFQIALRDLGIRGAGNLLGAAQSGHIAAMGFTLYCQLLKATVSRLKGEKPAPVADTEIRLDSMELTPGTPDGLGVACLPYSYIEDEPQRISAYRQLASCVTRTELDELSAALSDRYGPQPDAVKRLLRVAALRIGSAAAGLQSVVVRKGKVWLVSDGLPLLINGKLPLIKDNSMDAQLTKLEELIAGELATNAGKKL